MRNPWHKLKSCPFKAALHKWEDCYKPPLQGCAGIAHGSAYLPLTICAARA